MFQTWQNSACLWHSYVPAAETSKVIVRDRKSRIIFLMQYFRFSQQLFREFEVTCTGAASMSEFFEV